MSGAQHNPPEAPTQTRPLAVPALTAGQYVPALLTKRGEQVGLQQTAGTTRAALTPLFVAHPVDWDFEKDQPKKSVQQHLSRLPEHLAGCWPGRSAFVDLEFLPDDPMDDGRHPLTWLVEESAGRGIGLVPAASPGRSAAYLNAVRDLVAGRHADLCLRLRYEEWPSVLGETQLRDFLRAMGVPHERTHLVLDLGDDVGDAALAALTAQLLAHGPWSAWKSLVVLGTGMPRMLPAGAGTHPVPRREWVLYRQLLRNGRLPRRPVFGDYGVAHPDPTQDVDPRIMNVSASLRYTTTDQWLAVKGGLFKGSGGRSLGADAVPPVCRVLAAHPDYLGPGHCAFERWIDDVVHGRESGGNPQKWRSMATSHHLQFVTDQLAALGGPTTWR